MNTTNRSRVAAALLLALTLASRAGAQPPTPPVSIDDVLSFRQIQEVRMAPDGQSVAFVARTPKLADKRNEDSLMVVRVADGQTRTLDAGDKMSDATWAPDGRAIYVLRERLRIRTLVRVDAASGAVSELWSTGDPIDGFTVSPDGSRAVIARPIESAPAVAQSRIDSGLVFEYGKHNGRTFINREYSDAQFEEIVLIDLKQKESRTVARLPYEGFRHLGFVDRLAISPDNKLLALELVRAGKPTEGGPPFNHDVGVMDLQTGSYVEPLPGSIRTEMSPLWLGEGSRLFFVSEGHGIFYDAATRSVERPDWPVVPDGQTWITNAAWHAETRAVYLLARRTLVRFSLADRKVDQVATIYQPPSFAADFRRYAFVSETSNERPEVAVFDMERRSERRLTALNPWLDQRALGRVEPIDVTNRSGVKTTGYLVYPVGYVKGQRYPLIIGTYGFQGKFILTAEWHTTFPAQTLAGEGYAVLLLNRPPLPSAQVIAGDPVKARDNEGWQVLSAFEAAIDLLDQRGIADPKNVGLYGWSHGAYIVEFLLAHSKRRFSAAIIGEGGDYNPGGYWVFGAPGWPAIYVNTFGGPLNSRTAEAYLSFSPALNVERMTTPLLMEFVVENGHYGFEIYVPLREARVPAELVTYDGEEHNFVRPTVRFASMHRKVDWLNFWMRGTEDNNPAKAEQYARWRQLRSDRP